MEYKFKVTRIIFSEYEEISVEAGDRDEAERLVVEAAKEKPDWEVESTQFFVERV